MAVAIQKALLRRFIEKMYDEGMVNNQFVELQELKEAIRSDFVVRAITLYCMATRNLFSLLTNLIAQTELDFYQVAVHARELFERSSSVGAEHVKIASADIVQSCRASDKKQGGPRIQSLGGQKEGIRMILIIKQVGPGLSCTQALNQTKKEFSKLRRNLETLVQMERKIIDLENGNEECQILHNWHRLSQLKGIMNDQFSEIQALKSADNPDRVVQLINVYCVEVGTILSELKSCINLPDVDFSKFAAQAHKIEDKSLGIGAEHVRRACVDLIQACEQKHKRKVSQALDWLQNEFSITQGKLDAFAKMERRIIRVESRQVK